MIIYEALGTYENSRRKFNSAGGWIGITMISIGRVTAAIALILFIVANTEVVAQSISTSEVHLSPLQIEEAKLQASSDKVRYYVIISALPESTLTERSFRNMKPKDKDNATSLAFYAASARLVFNQTWDEDSIRILNTYNGKNNLKSLMLDFEKDYFDRNHSWPDAVAVDVDSLNARIIDRMIIR